MIVTAIVDPSALNPKYLKKDVYKLQVEQFLAGILKNGLLVSDREGKLLSEMKQRINASPSRSQKIQIQFTEIVKSNKRVVKCEFSPTGQDITKKCCELEGHLRPDVIIASHDHREYFQKNCPKTKVITFTEYSDSDFEKERDQYMTELQPLHELKSCEWEDLFIRVVRFAKHLYIYDKQIGTGNNLRHFRRGIEFILDLWKKHGYHFGGEPETRIYTCESRGDPESAKREIEKVLVDKLNKKFKLSINLFVKECNSEFRVHARYLQTQSTIILMERGFDFLEEDGSIKQTEIQLKPKSSKHLEKFRRLPSRGSG